MEQNDRVTLSAAAFQGPEQDPGGHRREGEHVRVLRRLLRLVHHQRVPSRLGADARDLGGNAGECGLG